MKRTAHYNINPLFKSRYSPREFLDKEIQEEDLYALLEAASTAPSCFNEQPWRFVLGYREKFMEILAEANREWNQDTKAFILICSKNNFARNNKINGYSSFDSGTAWGYMTIEGETRGISLHAMAGFSKEKAREIFKLEEDLTPEAVIALGYAEVAKELTPRKPLEDLILKR